MKTIDIKGQSRNGLGKKATRELRKAVTGIEGLREGDVLTTYLSNGKVQSVIKNCEKYEEDDVL